MCIRDRSSHHRTHAEDYAFLPAEEILKDCRMQERKGIHRYSVVTAGKSLEGEDFSRALKAYRVMSEQCSVSLCASHGFLSYDAFLDLKKMCIRDRGIAVLSGIGAGIGIGIATSGATDAIARQPEATGEINKTLLLGCALAESTAIYGLVVAIIIMFVL